MRTIVIASQKGGVAKTTTAVQMSAILNRLGHKTLLIDTDQQCNSSNTFRAQIEGVPTLYDVLVESGKNKKLISDVIQHTEIGDIVAADPLLAEAETKLSSSPNGLFELSDSFEKSDLSEYEYCVIDTGPNVNQLLMNSLIVADDVVIPIKASEYALQGLGNIYEAIKTVQKRFNSNLSVAGILLTMHSSRTKVGQAGKSIIEAEAERMGTRVFDTSIRTTVTVEESQVMKMPLIDYSSGSGVELDYEDFIKEYLGVE
ncbi:ParA family protein [Butyrivibrio sp. AE3004]|uniref:ParA family protein n=1 Tax=Butyrivibrio sp. AE3004 TaxID=1506994 RepID=UPI0004948384|nr:ParA family protein [Butyrivibrio sp. AE3004]